MCVSDRTYVCTDGPLIGGICGGTIARTHTVTDDCTCLLYTSDAADERSSVDLGGRRPRSWLWVSSGPTCVFRTAPTCARTVRSLAESAAAASPGRTPSPTIV